MLAEIGKFVGAKVATAIIFLAVTAAGIWCYQNPDSVRAFGTVVKYVLFWLLVSAALPWTSFLFMRPLLRWQSEHLTSRTAAATSVLVIAAYCVMDVLLALYLGGWSFDGAFTWTVVLLGLIAAGAYNFVICESLARYVDR